jgi:hypothetical protein
MTRSPLFSEIAGYLRARGWAPTGSWNGGTIWSRRQFDVLVPPEEAADAAARRRQLLSCVADAEGRTLREVERDIVSSGTDVIAYRLVGAAAHEVPLPAGIRAVNAVRQLVTTCAHEVLGNVPGTPDRHDITTMLGRSLLYLPYPEFGLEVQLPVDGAGESLGRLTALRVLRSSAAVLEATISSDDAAFDVAFDRGVSEAACRALADLAGAERRAPFALRFRWSKLAPEPAERPVVEFPEGTGERIRTGGRLRATATRTPDGSVEGRVTGLSDDREGPRWQISVRGVLTTEKAPAGEPKIVQVRLGSAERYSAAIEAHRTARRVRARGSLTRQGGKPELTIAENGFTVIDDEQTRQ